MRQLLIAILATTFFALATPKVDAQGPITFNIKGFGSVQGDGFDAMDDAIDEAADDAHDQLQALKSLITLLGGNITNEVIGSDKLKSTRRERNINGAWWHAEWELKGFLSYEGEIDLNLLFFLGFLN